MAAPAYRRLSFYETLRKLHLVDGLKLCLDAGDRLSFEGGGDTWRDLSGNGYDFYLGSGTGADSADPTHNGVSGRRTKDEYFSYDGGDWLTLAQSNPTWVNNLHKNNALLTMCAWFYTANIATGVSEFIFGTSGFSGTTIGCAFAVGQAADGDIGFGIQDANAGANDSIGTTSARIVAGAFTFLAVSFDEAATAITLQINATQEAKTFSYASPSASSATYTARIGDGGDGLRPFKSGARLANFSAWEGVALSAAQLTSIYNATKGKFGL